MATYIKESYAEREISIRYGIKLFTAIYEPKARSEKCPILLNRTLVLPLTKK